MRADTPSRTAAWVAIARAMAQHLPPEARMADDPYGAARGFTLVRDVSISEAARELLPPAFAAQVVTRDQRFALVKSP